MRPDVYGERVVRGVAALDAYGPPDWRERVDVATLRVDNSRYCVLGQVYGDYHSDEAAKFRVWCDLGSGVRHGFDLLTFDDEDERPTHVRVADLNDAWREALLGGGE